MKLPRIMVLAALTAIMASCGDRSQQAAAPAPDAPPSPPPPPAAIRYKDSLYVKMAIDTTLSYVDGFEFDSAVAVDYEGSEEGSSMVLDGEGRWLNTVKKTATLNRTQSDELKSILSSKATYASPVNAACFAPRLGIVYFLNGEVRAQSAICLSCSAVESSAILGSWTRYSSFNTAAGDHLGRICESLGFSHCRNDKE